MRFTAERYIQQVLDGPFIQIYDEITGEHGFMWFQQDGTGCHKAKEVTEWFEDNNVDHFPNLACSPNINPIEPC
jgi:hypothetical protein